MTVEGLTEAKAEIRYIFEIHGSETYRMCYLDEELDEFREIFNLVDKDGGGSISKEELGELMDTLGINATQEEIDLMINEIDQDGNGEIDFEEFVMVMSRRVELTYTQQQVINAFKIFEDDESPGYVTLEKLKDVLINHCSKNLTEEQLKEIIGQLEIDKEGKFNYLEYINMMMSS